MAAGHQRGGVADSGATVDVVRGDRLEAAGTNMAAAYRYPILRGEVAERARDVIRQIYHAREVMIMRGSVSPGHIHLLVSAPPQLSPPKLAQYVKGKLSRQLQEDFRICTSDIGASTRGRGATFARRWALWIRKRSWSALKTRNETRMRRASR
jgi:REP element-mobilizing transposase RayT